MKSIAILLMLVVNLNVLGKPATASDTSWAKLRVGQVAYLAAQLESDNDPNTRPVCKTNAQQIAFWRMQIDDCPHRRWGTLVVVTDIVPGFDDDHTTAFSKDDPFVGIRSQDGRWIGWVQAESLEPVIPRGTRLVMTAIGNGAPSVYRHRHGGVSNQQISLGSPVTVEVLEQDSPTDGDCSLLVKALTGPKIGTSGWTCDAGTVLGTKVSSGYLN